MAVMRLITTKEAKMEQYANLGGDSGIFAYAIKQDSIEVQFRDGLCYLYTHQSAGITDVEHMKELAVAGRGLNSFISRVVKKRYASKGR